MGDTPVGVFSLFKKKLAESGTASLSPVTTEESSKKFVAKKIATKKKTKRTTLSVVYETFRAMLSKKKDENKDIINSIPQLNKDIVSFEMIKDYVSSDLNSTEDLDLDSILDKISSTGFDSLSDEEKEFLDKKSKEE